MTPFRFLQIWQIFSGCPQSVSPFAGLLLLSLSPYTSHFRLDLVKGSLLKWRHEYLLIFYLPLPNYHSFSKAILVSIKGLQPIYDVTNILSVSTLCCLQLKLVFVTLLSLCGVGYRRASVFQKLILFRHNNQAYFAWKKINISSEYEAGVLKNLSWC